MSTRVGVPPDVWHKASPKQKALWRAAAQQAVHAHPVLTGSGSDAVQLRVLSGNAAFPPDFQSLPFQPFGVRLPEGACRYVPMEALPVSGQKPRSTKLYLCYAKRTLALDPSRIDPSTQNGSLVLTYNPLMVRGLLYTGLSSQGYVRLRSARLWVKVLHSHPMPL